MLQAAATHQHTHTRTHSTKHAHRRSHKASRINRTYERWWLARQSFGGVNSSCSQIAHLAAIWCDDVEHVKRLIAWLNVFQYTVLMVCVFCVQGVCVRRGSARRRARAHGPPNNTATSPT